MVKSIDFGLVCTVITTVAALSLDALKVWMPCLLHLFVNSERLVGRTVCEPLMQY